MSKDKGRDRFYRLHESINLIDNHQFEKTITELNDAILPVDDITDKEEKRLVVRSNSFINGAIKNLKTLPPPPQNILNAFISPTLSPEYYERSKKIEIAKECIRTAIQGPRRHSADNKEMEMLKLIDRVLTVTTDGFMLQQESNMEVMQVIEEKFAVPQALEKLLKDAQADKADDNQGQQPKEPELIKWRSSQEKLEQLAGELKAEGFIDDPGLFAGQFQCAGIQAAKERCQWEHSDRSLGYLLNKLQHNKLIQQDYNRTQTVKAHFLKKNGAFFSDSFSQNMNNQSAHNKKPSKGSDKIDRVLFDVFGQQ